MGMGLSRLKPKTDPESSGRAKEFGHEGGLGLRENEFV
jgi:hypothetical protein